MTGSPRPNDRITSGCARRTALLSPLALSACGLFDDWFGSNKKPLPGKREPVAQTTRGLTVDEAAPRVTLPPPIRNIAWPQAGGNPAHRLTHLAASDRLAQAWAADIGAGGGYRRKIMAQPVAANGFIYTMDSAGMVSAFELATGARRWRFDSNTEDADSTNVGGGLALEGGVLYAVNGVANLCALDAAAGTLKWRRDLGAPARSAPTVAAGRLFVTTIDDKLLALALDDGHSLWTHQASTAVTAVLGQPAPAYSNGLVVAGFGSGELTALRADTGSLLWSDSLGATRGRSNVTDFSSIRGLPVVDRGRVFAISLGGLAVGIDLPTGRRLWERSISGEDSPCVVGSWLFAISTSQEMAALGVEDGRAAWVSALPRWDNPEKQRGAITWFGPLLAGDRLVAIGTNGWALAVSPYTGEILGRQELSGRAAPIAPIVVDGTLLVVTDDGRLTAWR